MRNILPFVLALPLLFACGRGFSDTPDGGSHPVTDGGDDGGDDGGACASELRNFGCALPCGGETDPVCIDGQWQCESYAEGEGVDCPPPPEDAGPDACSYETVGCSSVEPCPGVYSTPVCENGQWSCVWTGICEDGGEPDAQPFDDAGAELFSCGNIACDPSVSYCQITTGGAVSEDGGTNTSFFCDPLPSTCASGEPATCACVQALSGVGCGCIASKAGDVIVTCDVP